MAGRLSARTPTCQEGSQLDIQDIVPSTTKSALIMGCQLHGSSRHWTMWALIDNLQVSAKFTWSCFLLARCRHSWQRRACAPGSPACWGRVFIPQRRSTSTWNMSTLSDRECQQQRTACLDDTEVSRTWLVHMTLALDCKIKCESSSSSREESDEWKRSTWHLGRVLA